MSTNKFHIGLYGLKSVQASLTGQRGIYSVPQLGSRRFMWLGSRRAHKKILLGFKWVHKHSFHNVPLDVQIYSWCMYFTVHIVALLLVITALNMTRT